MLNHPSFRKYNEATKARSQALEKYLKSTDSPKLQLGTGTNVRDNWFNTDLEPQLPNVYVLDATKPFPIADNTFEYIFSEHQIEHISYADGCFMLCECFRLLKLGGALRIATPNLSMLIDLYRESHTSLQKKYIHFVTDHFVPSVRTYHPTFVINNAFRNWGHQFLYDEAILRTAMMEAGFTDIKHAVPGQSNLPVFCNLEMHGRFIGDEEINAFETMVLEGKKACL
jgi:predicted SAM-dependent methyltransferase